MQCIKTRFYTIFYRIVDDSGCVLTPAAVAASSGASWREVDAAQAKVPAEAQAQAQAQAQTAEAQVARVEEAQARAELEAKQLWEELEQTQAEASLDCSVS
jgi:regulator of protease activity HflC (stomatin/prohibitin superfamily)